MRRRTRSDSGAAAVEFALVVPILAALLLGIVDYGIYFTDRLAVTQGVREAARDAVVGTGSLCGDGTLDCLADDVADEVGAIGGNTYVHVDTVRPGSTTGDDWEEGNELRVCVVVMTDSLTGVTPLPERINDAVRMRIEHDASRGTHGQDGEPPGGWGWCHTGA